MAPGRTVISSVLGMEKPKAAPRKGKTVRKGATAKNAVVSPEAGADYPFAKTRKNLTVPGLKGTKGKY